MFFIYVTKELVTKPLAIGAMNAAELNAELEKGYADVVAGRLHDLDDVVAEMQSEYEL